MFTYFRFSLPRAVTEQLVERLQELPPSSLTRDSLKTLGEFQIKSETTRGVYVIYYGRVAVYAGKADDLGERLGKHLAKLRGRRGINLDEVKFIAILLDENWSTSANEGLLIDHYKSKNECEWNGNGFGPKDPGKERDTTTPSWFDKKYPVREDWPLEDIPDQADVREILQVIKIQLPFLLRFENLGKKPAYPVNLKDVPRNAKAVLKKCAQALGPKWQLTLLKFGFILYPESKEFKFGERIHP